MKKIISLLMSAATTVTAIPFAFVSESIVANAAESYPV